MSTSTPASGDDSAPSLNGLVVMISHASKHLPTTEDEHGRHPGLAESVYERLNALGATVLLDKRCLVPGDDWNQEIYVGWINECDAAIVLMSDKALESNPVRDEATVLRYRHRLGTMPALLPIFIDEVDETVLVEKWGDTSQWSVLSAKKVAASAGTAAAAQAIVDAFRELAKKRNLTRPPAGPVVNRAQHHAKPHLPDSTRDNVASALRTATEKLRPDRFDASKLDTAALRNAAAHAWCVSGDPADGSRLFVQALHAGEAADIAEAMGRLIVLTLCGEYDLPNEPRSPSRLHGLRSAVLPCRSLPEAQMALTALTTGCTDFPGLDGDRVEIIVPRPASEGSAELLGNELAQELVQAGDEGNTFLDQLEDRAEMSSPEPVFALIGVPEDRLAFVEPGLVEAIQQRFGRGLVPLFYGQDPGALCVKLGLGMLSIFEGETPSGGPRTLDNDALERFLSKSGELSERQRQLTSIVRRQLARSLGAARR